MRPLCVRSQVLLAISLYQHADRICVPNETAAAAAAAIGPRIVENFSLLEIASNQSSLRSIHRLNGSMKAVQVAAIAVAVAAAALVGFNDDVEPVSAQLQLQRNTTSQPANQTLVEASQVRSSKSALGIKLRLGL